MIRLLMLVCCLCFPLISFASDKPCADADPRNAGQVKSCISRSQNLVGLDGAGKDFRGCSQIRTLFAQAAGIKVWGSGADAESLPSCGVVSQVLTDMNGTTPVWSGCVGYVDQGRDLNACVASLKKAGKIGSINQRSCAAMKQALVGLEVGMLGVQHRAPPSCLTIAKALEQNYLRLYAYDCRAYEPNSQVHINRCLHSVLHDQGYAPQAANLSCDQLRMQYKMAVESVHDWKSPAIPEGPANFQTSTCAMMEQAVASFDPSVNANRELASGSGQPAERATPPQANGREEAVAVQAAEPRSQTRTTAAVESASVQQPMSTTDLLKQQAMEQVLQSETASGALQQMEEYETQYDAATTEEAVAYEEEVTLDSVEEEAKKKLKNKLFKTLGL